MAKIIIGYATRYGSTKETAEIIAGVLNENGHKCDVKNIMDIRTLAGYDAFICGSSIHMGKWLPEAREFMESRVSELMGIDLYVFTVGITLSDPTEHNVRKALFSTDEIKQYVNPKEIGLFPGKLIKDELVQSDRDLVTLAKPPFGDFRDTAKVTEWAQMLHKKYFSVTEQ